MKFDVFEEQKSDVLDAIDNDSRFLAANNLMDYSLLFIKAKLPKH
jgi:hypothetical protein